MTSGWSEVLPDTADIRQGRLSIAACDVADLAERYGTPLYVYDETTLRNRARRVRAAFEPLNARVSFAAKACSTLEVLRVFQEEGLDLDAVSAGELEAALRAGFQPSQIHLHGNFKSEEELEMAVRLGLHAVVLDNEREVDVLAEICHRLEREVRVMLRSAFAVQVDSHPYLHTSGSTSKFGVRRGSSAEDEILQRLEAKDALQLMGVHAHLGSQLADPTAFGRAAQELISFAASLRSRGFPVEEVSVGGGWKVAYRGGESDLSPERVAEVIAPMFLCTPEVRPAVEPGRSLVARAAVAVYRVGSVKTMDGLRIVAVDGGMGDNPRPALYGAEYSPFPVTDACSSDCGPADVVGRYCEAGDVLARRVLLPAVAPGDLLCLPVAGAYQLAMASAYNLVPQPAAVMVGEGSARLITRRATIDDLLSRELRGA